MTFSPHEAASFMLGCLLVLFILATGFTERDSPMKAWLTLLAVLGAVGIMAYGFTHGFTAPTTILAVVYLLIVLILFHRLDAERRIARDQWREYQEGIRARPPRRRYHP